MKTGLVGPTFQQRSLPFNAQRTINLFPVLDEMGKEVAALYKTPGLSTFADTGAGPVRGGFMSAKDRVFFVTGINLVEVSSSGSVTTRGGLLTSSGAVSMAEGTLELAVCDGASLYSFTYSNNAFAKVTAAGLPASVGFVTNVDGYFIAVENDTGRFYISGLNDLSTWGALDFATAENAPDNLTAAVKAIGQLWLLGSNTVEVWTNTGASAFPFSRISGGVLESGILAAHTALEIDNTLMWLGRDDFGEGIVYRADGFTPRRVSTTPIEKRIQESANKADIRAWAYQEEGHLFYILTGGGLETSLVLDLTTQQWHERAFLNDQGEFEQHLGTCHISAFGKHLVGSRLDGKIYEMSLAYFDDDGEELAWRRVFTHISNEDRRTRYNRFDVSLETGVGLQSGNGSDPKVALEISKDLGRTWSDPAYADTGAAGEYSQKVSFRRIGMAETLTLALSGSDPVKTALIGGYLS